MQYCVFWSQGKALLAGISRANRDISKVCLQIIFVYGLETGLLALVRKNKRREMFVSKQDRVVNLILIGCNIYLKGYQRINMNYGNI